MFARGNNSQAIFLDDVDRYRYLSILSEVCKKAEWNRLAYCLMGNHLHLLIETPLPNLSEGMHKLQGNYARRFNYRHGRSGHLFQERFGCKLIQSDRQLVATTGYIEMNPVEAGLCRTPEQWPWTDCRNAHDRCALIYGQREVA